MSDNVISIGDLSIRRLEKRWFLRKEDCRHRNLTWDKHGDFITCDDCKMQLSSSWVLGMFMEVYERARNALTQQEALLLEERARELHRLASKKVDEVWRTKTMVPCCPHCDRGILPEDGLGASKMGRRYEIGRRKNDQNKKPGLPVPDS